MNIINPKGVITFPDPLDASRVEGGWGHIISPSYNKLHDWLLASTFRRRHGGCVLVLFFTDMSVDQYGFGKP